MDIDFVPEKYCFEIVEKREEKSKEKKMLKNFIDKLKNICCGIYLKHTH
jgi:hypothetical protein